MGITEIILLVLGILAFVASFVLPEKKAKLNAQDIKELEAYCHARFIDLVPNQNSFGHMYQWLKNPELSHLAVAPEGGKGGTINPLIGSAGGSAVPMAARISEDVGREENPSNHLLMHAMGPNVAGVIGSAIAAGFLLAIV